MEKTRQKLSAKDNRMFVYGYWLLKSLDKEDVIEAYLQRLHCGGNVVLQSQAFDLFWDNFKETEKSLKNATKKDKPANEKKKRGRPRKERVIVYDHGENLLEMLIAESRKEIQEKPTETPTEMVTNDGESAADDDEESLVEVRKFVFKDTTYLIDDLNNIYDLESHEEIGIFNNSTKVIDFA